MTDHNRGYIHTVPGILDLEYHEDWCKSVKRAMRVYIEVLGIARITARFGSVRSTADTGESAPEAGTVYSFVF